MIPPAPALTSLSVLLLLHPNSAEKKQIYLAGTFPIGGSEGWQGGQVGEGRDVGGLTTTELPIVAGLSASRSAGPGGCQQQPGYSHQLPHQPGSQG